MTSIFNTPVGWLLLALSLPIQMSAQLEDVIDRIRAEEASNQSAIKEISYLVEPNRDHSLFLTDDWENMALLTTENKWIYFTGRYNVLNNVLEAQVGNQVHVIIPAHIRAVKMGRRILITQSAVKIGLGNFPLYFEVLASGKIHLLHRFVLGANIEGGNMLSYESRGKKKYMIQTQPYFTTDFQQIHELETNKKFILELFADEKEAVEKYIRNNRIRFRNTEDLVSLFNFYNDLVELGDGP